MSRAPVKHEIHSQRVPTVSALAERVDTSTVSARSICLAIGEPVRVCGIDDGDGRTLIVEPLRFHVLIRAQGRVWVHSQSRDTRKFFHAAASGEQFAPSQPAKS